MDVPGSHLDGIIVRYGIAHDLIDAVLHAFHGAYFTLFAIHIRVICHGSGQNGALEGNRGA